MYDLKNFVFSLLIIISTLCATLLVLHALEVLNMFSTLITSNMPLHNSIFNMDLNILMKSGIVIKSHLAF